MAQDENILRHYIYILILEAPAGVRRHLCCHAVASPRARRLPSSEQVFYAVDVEGEREAEGLVKRIA